MTFYRPHERLFAPVSGDSRTKQAFKDECDINRILIKYQRDGVLTHLATYGGRYEELPSNLDYQESLNAIIAAEAAFMSLPSSLRSRFGNDPATFLDFVGNPANENELVELGLANRVSTPPREGAPSQSSQSDELTDPPPVDPGTGSSKKKSAG